MAGTPVVNIGGDNINAGQATAVTAASLLVPVRLGRVNVTLIGGATAIAIGPASVTPTTGLLLGTTPIKLETSAAIYGVVASGSQVVSFIETF